MRCRRAKGSLSALSRPPVDSFNLDARLFNAVRTCRAAAPAAPRPPVVLQSLGFVTPSARVAHLEWLPRGREAAYALEDGALRIVDAFSSASAKHAAAPALHGARLRVCARASCSHLVSLRCENATLGRRVGRRGRRRRADWLARAVPPGRRANAGVRRGAAGVAG